MKWLSFLAILPSAAVAFQQVAPTVHHHRSTTTLSFFPDNFARAEQCATHSDSCNVDELDQLVDEINGFQSSDMGKLQGREDYKDTQKVFQMLRAQSELKHHQEDYLKEHHRETYMDNAWNNNSAGLGLGLW